MRYRFRAATTSGLLLARCPTTLSNMRCETKNLVCHRSGSSAHLRAVPVYIPTFIAVIVIIVSLLLYYFGIFVIVVIVISFIEIKSATRKVSLYQEFEASGSEQSSGDESISHSDAVIQKNSNNEFDQDQDSTIEAATTSPIFKIKLYFL